MKEIRAGVYITIEGGRRPPPKDLMMTTVFRLSVVALTVALAACQGGNDASSTAANPPMALEIYSVPAARTDEVSQALGKVLDQRAKVTVATPGQVLVYAPRSAQHSIAQAIGTLTRSHPDAPDSTQLRLRFWVVDAISGTATDDPRLAPLAATLAPLRQTMGPLHFTLDLTAAATVASNRRGTLSLAGNGYPLELAFTAGTHAGEVQGNGTINLDLQYEDRGQIGLAKLETHIATRAGQYVVLAQAPGACPPALPGQTAPACPTRPASRLLIVRIDRLPPVA